MNPRSMQIAHVSTILVVMCSMMLGVVPGRAAEESAEEREPFRYDAKGHRDPFRPLVINGVLVAVKSRHHAGSMPVLYGILWDPRGQSIALINELEAKVGDMIGGYRVMEIREDAVVLANGGEPVVLQITFETPSAALSP